MPPRAVLIRLAQVDGGGDDVLNFLDFQLMADRKSVLAQLGLELFLLAL